MTNLKPLCKMHHQLKTKKRWTVDVNPDGNEAWTSYRGFTHTKKPAWFPLPEPLPLATSETRGPPASRGANEVLRRSTRHRTRRLTQSLASAACLTSCSRSTTPALLS